MVLQRNTDFKDLPEEGIEPLKEHALNFYLPFDGGVGFGAKGQDKKNDPRYKLYAVEFQPNCTSREAPVKLNSFDEIEKYLKIRGDWEDNKSLIEWGLKRGFSFYGHEVWDESLFTYEEVVNIRMTQPNKNTSIDRPLKTESFFKIGLTLQKSAKRRGGGKYKNILFEKDLAELQKKINADEIETFIYFRIFFKYWKDKVYFASQKDIGLTFQADMHHHLGFPGCSEAFLYDDHQEKLKIVQESINLLEELSTEEIKTTLEKYMNFRFIWCRIQCYKQLAFLDFTFNPEQPYLYDYPKMWHIHWYEEWSMDCPFLKKIGFKDLWRPEDGGKLIEVFDKKAEELILPNTKNYK